MGQPLVSASLTAQLDFKCRPSDSAGMLQGVLVNATSVKVASFKKSILTIRGYCVLGTVLSA